jgi:excisionase family DNA binding protein
MVFASCQKAMKEPTDMESFESKIARRTLTIEEAAQELGICKSAAYDAARQGKIPTLRVGRRWLVPRVALDRLLEKGAA